MPPEMIIIITNGLSITLCCSSVCGLSIWCSCTAAEAAAQLSFGTMSCTAVSPNFFTSKCTKKEGN